ncbi:uncharacterized protein [Miscanthus floridulus]|uniref:uncharacterized protein n=1 Tax=Miscanthus floridulus TaxID=154761 RepID=UPI003457989E
MAPPWVILHRTLHPAKDDNISVALRELPRVSVLNVPKSVHPDARHADKFPYLIAAGRLTLLLCFSNMSTDNTGLMMVRQFLPSDKYNNLRRATTTCVAERIPQRTGSMPVKYDLGSVGLAPTPFGGCLIAELQVTRRSERAKLLIFTGGRQWFQHKPLYPMSADERDWAPAGVVAHNGRLWWFDLSWGILSCDPSVVNPVLRFHKLPPNRGLGRFEPFIHCIRCISVSDNEVRYAEIGRYPEHGEDKVFVWTMTWIPASPPKSGPPSKFPPNSEPPTLEWVKSYEMRFSDLWSDITYTTTPLVVNQIPEILFVSPRQPNVVYFFLDRFVFGVDVAEHRVLKVVNDDAHALFHPTARRCVLPWDLPPSIANGNHVTTQYSNERECYCARDCFVLLCCI